MSADSNTQTPTATRRPGNLRPFLCALGALIPVYVGVRFTTGLTMLAVACATLAALIAFIACRLIQFRGRLSLSIVVIGFPLLAAILFATYQALTPFRERQRSISMLRDAGISYGKRLPDQVGEWKRDYNGVMLPVWLANRMGPDSMTSVRSVDASLDAIQGIDYRSLDMTELSRIQLTRLSEYPAIEPELIDWLNQQQLKQLAFAIDYYSDEDAAALRKLTHPYGARIYAGTRPTGDLTALHGANYLNIVGHKLTDKQAEQICKLNLTMLQLEVRHPTAEAIDALAAWEAEVPNMMLSGAKLDADRWRALSRVPVSTLRLLELDPASINAIPDDPSGVGIDYLNVAGNPLSYDEIRRLIRLFRPTEFACSTELTKEQIQSLWESPQLRSVSINLEQWQTHNRP